MYTRTGKWILGKFEGLDMEISKIIEFGMLGFEICEVVNEMAKIPSLSVSCATHVTYFPDSG